MPTKLEVLGIGVKGVLLFCCTLFFLSANNKAVKTITWEDLIPPNYSPEKLFQKYGDRLNKVEDGSVEAIDLYTKIMEELNNAPVNTKLKKKKVRLTGFVTPLKIHDQLIVEFLLVPYFGQCIHLPPPPVNQTVLVTLAKKEGVFMDDIFEPYVVEGQFSVERHETDLAMAGYKISGARVSVYESGD